ncbi:hypothetical protein NQ315_002854 [Exocentrus adspersus]|uniref:Reverse transcriptase domain-containing protein n=1 Tax=Exocentrus adspersus TaxID=1586481 RepID=A0AAV8V8R7_9CUCU|nr:hypothetical protein NQ315_002854 [Exocentrus adspersus]
MEDLRTAIKLTHKNIYRVFVPIHKDHQQFLTFQIESDLYQFTCLPFGQRSASFCFTKLLKPVVSHLRSLGISVVNYLDDFIIFGESYIACLFPEYTYSHEAVLGFMIDSVRLKIELPIDKKTRIVTTASHFLTRSQCKIRELAQFIGVLVAACPGVKYGFFYCKSLEREKFLALRKNNGNYNATMELSEHAKADILWWKKHIAPAIGKPYPGRSEVIRKAFLSRNVPDSAIATIMSSVSPATLRQYDSTYKLWWHYCSTENISLFKPTIEKVVSFLQHLANTTNYKYGTFNSHISALSLICSTDLVSSPVLKRFKKGISRLRPSRPKYSLTWDPLPVLNYIERLPSPLTLQTLSQKLTLLALEKIIL